MSIGQDQPVVPPIENDKQLIDFARVIQRSFTTLFQAAHYHEGQRGVLTAPPKSTDGNPGDILIGFVSGSVYLYVKVTRTAWYRFGPATLV